MHVYGGGGGGEVKGGWGQLEKDDWNFCDPEELTEQIYFSQFFRRCK